MHNCANLPATTIRGLLVSRAETPGNAHAAATAIASGADQPIARLHGALTAFVGRALRGPVNQPVRIESFAHYQQEFGGLWQPSSLSYAVEQFFEQGGSTALIVRVANGAAAPTISLPCGTQTLVLQAIAPGTREYLRAAVDYDNLAAGANDSDTTQDSFNLVVQRVRAPGSERIEVQETYRRVSVNPGTQRFVTKVLLESQLVRVRGEVPPLRPDSTYLPSAKPAVSYCQSNNDGDDGAPLSDYDVIGSAQAHTGLFALTAVEDIGFVYIPPLTRNTDIGASTLCIAEKFCREHRAILIVDPPAAWKSAEQAVRGIRSLSFYSQHALMYFPRIIATDRLRGRSEVFANGGAVAGMLARLDEQRPLWAMDSAEPDQMLRASARLECALTEAERWRLATHGINTLRSTRNSAAVRLLPRTLAGGVNSTIDSGYLPAQRLFDFVINSIERGTRWVAWSGYGPALWPRVKKQITHFLAELTALGAFPAASDETAYLVVCDERVNSADDVLASRTNILVALASMRAGYYHGFLITHGTSGSSVKAVTVNPLKMPSMIEPKISPLFEATTQLFAKQAM